jgi:hypothetical protein
VEFVVIENAEITSFEMAPRVEFEYFEMIDSATERVEVLVSEKEW